MSSPWTITARVTFSVQYLCLSHLSEYILVHDIPLAHASATQLHSIWAVDVEFVLLLFSVASLVGFIIGIGPLCAASCYIYVCSSRGYRFDEFVIVSSLWCRRLFMVD